jgi:hypothetical protein
LVLYFIYLFFGGRGLAKIFEIIYLFQSRISIEIIPMLIGTFVLIGQKQNLKRVYTSINP